jgi:hypothetical protein
MKWLLYVWVILLCAIWLKSISVGSEFDFILWFRFRKMYREWYFKKRVPESFREYLRRVGYHE